MKNLTAIIFLGALLLIGACREEVTNYAFDGISAPSNLTAEFNIASDLSGTVTVTPSATGASSFAVDFGDGTDVQQISPGESAENIYASEGEFEVSVTATGSTGLTSEFVKAIRISFQQPENLSLEVTIDPADPYTVIATPSAENASMYDLSFGETGEIDTTILDGESVRYTYSEIGTYEVEAIAKGVSSTTISVTETIEIIGASAAINLPVTFESNLVDYSFITFGPDGDFTQVVDNPAPDMVNPTDRVAEHLKVDGSEVWAGTVFSLGEPIDFSSSNAMKMNVWSPKEGIPVLLKVENIDDPNIFYEVQATTTTSNEWEELMFDMSTIDLSQSYQRIVLFFNFGTSGDGSTYYFDNIDLVRNDPPSGGSIQDFEGMAPAFTVFGGADPTMVIANPDPSGSNTTGMVAEFTKTDGAEVWAGNFFEIPEPLDLMSNPCITFQVWAPKSGVVVKLKLENADASITHEVDVTNTVSNAWEELTYDFSEAPAADYVRIVTFYDFGNNGDGSTYYYDEFEYCGAGPEETLLESFESQTTTFTAFGDIDPVQLVTNPDMSGENTTQTVAELLKNNGAQTWAGAFFEPETTLPSDDFGTFQFSVWAPKSGVTVKLKLENADASITHEVDVVNTVSNAWETLSYDFSEAPPADYTKIVVFFDFGNNGDGSTYYFDEFYHIK